MDREQQGHLDERELPVLKETQDQQGTEDQLGTEEFWEISDNLDHRVL